MRKVWILSLTLLLAVLLAVPAFASENYVIDDAGLLIGGQQEQLNRRAAEIAEQYEIGIYILTVEDFRDYGEEYEIFDVLWNYYHDNRLGFGENREGMILMLSMKERDYATFFYGENTEFAFNAYGQELMEEKFLDDFAEDLWFFGFMDYLSVAEDYMARAAAGNPVRESPWPMVFLFVVIALAISGIATLVEWGKMRNVAVKADALHYQAEAGLALTARSDQFVRQTMTRRKIQTQSSSSGSRSHSGGGGSGRSGKF